MTPSPPWLCATQLPITPPSSLRITTVAERGRPAPSGQRESFIGSAGSLRSLGDSPGCWMLTNIVRRSGVMTTPVTSQPAGPSRKRRISPWVGSQASIWLLGRPA